MPKEVDVLAGSDSPEWNQVQAHLDETSQGIRDVLNTLSVAESTARAYLEYLTGNGVAPRLATTKPPIPVRQTSPVEAEQPAIPHEQLAELRRELPPPIKSTDSNRKTHRRWIGPDGAAQPTASGVDEDSAAAYERLCQLGIPMRPAKTSDVEMKLAGRMVRNGIRHATLLINNVPCRGHLNCA